MSRVATTEEKTSKKKPILNLEEFIVQVKKTFGADSIVNATEKEGYRDVIPVTPVSLGVALGIGGYAKGKIHAIDGESSGGKSTICYDIIGNTQKNFNEKCLLIDKEDSYTRKYGASLGIDNENLIVVNPHTLEDMYDVLILSLSNKLFGTIVVDSVTSFAPQARFEGSEQMGIESRVNSDKMRLIADLMPNSNCALFLIQQIRQAMGGFGDPTRVSGGLAIPFYSHTRTRITRSEIDRENQQNVVKFTIIKNKLDVPFKVGTVVYKWGKGFDADSEMVELSLEFGIVTKEGKTYTLPETDVKIVGKKEVIKYLKENKEYTEKVIKPLVLAKLEENDLREEDEILDDNEAA